MKNNEIRKAITCSGLKYWQVAKAYGYTDSTFSRKLREELPPEEKIRVLSIIAELKAEGEAVF